MIRAVTIAVLGFSCIAGFAEARRAGQSWTVVVSQSLLDNPDLDARAREDETTAEDNSGDDETNAADNDDPSDDSSEDDADVEERNWSLTVALDTGYDSNYDEDSEDEVGSTLFAARVAAELEQRIGATDLDASADISALWLPELSFTRVLDANAEMNLERRLSQWLNFDASLEASLDLEDDPMVLDLSASVGAEYTTSTFELALRPRLETQTVVSGTAFNFEDDERTLDFIKPGISFRGLLRPEARVSPYVSADIARVTFSGSDEPDSDDDVDDDDNDVEDDDEEADFDDDDDDFLPVSARDAWTGRVSAGLRLKPTSHITAWLGARVSHRRFDSTSRWQTLTVISPEITAEWEIDDDLTLTAGYSRDFSETDSIGVLVDDESTLEAALEFDPALGFGGGLSGSYSRTREIGIGTTTKDYEAEAAVTYRFNEAALLRLGLAHIVSRSTDDDDDYERTVLRFGGEVKF